MNKYDFKDTIAKINENKLKAFNTIYEACEDIANGKTRLDVNILLTEELSELIKPIMKLERWEYGDEFLKCEYTDIIDNIYEELSDVIIMLIQFIEKNGFSHKDIIDNIATKILKIYETKFGEE